MLAAQICHAAGESSPGRLPAGTYAVILAASGPGELEELSRGLSRAGIRHVQVRENDEPFAGELMALGLEPALRSVVKRHVRRLPLLR
jgi:hypothetical protein